MRKELKPLYQYGIKVFGDEEKFRAWLEIQNPALGNVIPKRLLDNAAGIDLIKNELIRIEHGVLA